tara:strand:+ start:223 stop:807 length:585 start_codon:yes stop_codon:yes gene_type:complete
VKVFDNIITKSEQENLKNVLYGPEFCWYYISDVTTPQNKKQQRPALTHIYMKDGTVNSEYYDIIKKISDNVNKKIKKNLKPTLVRSFLQFPLNQNYTGTDIDTPHIDLHIPHTVYLYYVNDCDGDTVLYNYKSKKLTEQDVVKKVTDIPFYEDIKIKKKITPKQGRVVVFDGMTWHSSTQPTKGPRTIINFDMV